MATDPEESEGAQRELVPSELDEFTNAEMRLLFEESAHLVHFAKFMQWKMLAGILLLFGGLIVVAEYTATTQTFVKNIVIVSLLVGATSIYCIVIFQLWQNTEREKLRFIMSHFSNVAQENFGMKSSTEANIHRYTLLLFMNVGIITGNGVLIMVLSRLYN